MQTHDVHDYKTYSFWLLYFLDIFNPLLCQVLLALFLATLAVGELFDVIEVLGNDSRLNSATITPPPIPTQLGFPAPKLALADQSSY